MALPNREFLVPWWISFPFDIRVGFFRSMFLNLLPLFSFGVFKSFLLLFFAMSSNVVAMFVILSTFGRKMLVI